MIRFAVILCLLFSSCAERQKSEERFRVPTGAMEPTIMSGAYVLADMTAYRDSSPQMYDLVVFEAPAKAVQPGMEPKDLPKYVMRIVALPEDKIEFGGKGLLLNGKPLIVPPSASSANLIGIEAMPDHEGLKSFMKAGTSLVVPSESYFVVGDNGLTSADSRFWGPVPESNILGKVTTIE